MRLLKEFMTVILFLATSQAAEKEFSKKFSDSVKRAVETYSYTIPNVRYEENSGNSNNKVVVETIKSISPSEYLTSTGPLESNLETSTLKENVYVSSIIYKDIEEDVDKKVSTIHNENIQPSPVKKAPGHRYYSTITSGNKNSKTLTESVSSASPSAEGHTSEEVSTTSSPVSVSLTSSQTTTGENSITESPPKGSGIKSKIIRGRYSSSKKKTSKISLKHPDSKPEETGYNALHYDVGSLNSKPKGGMMGASYMRSSSPFYSFHVMLD